MKDLVFENNFFGPYIVTKTGLYQWEYYLKNFSSNVVRPIRTHTHDLMRTILASDSESSSYSLKSGPIWPVPMGMWELSL